MLQSSVDELTNFTLYWQKFSHHMWGHLKTFFKYNFNNIRRKRRRRRSTKMQNRGYPKNDILKSVILKK